MRKYTMDNLKFKITLLCALLYIISCTLYIHPAYAQSSSLDITNSYDLADPNIVNGDILSFTDKGLVRTDASTEEAIFGVVVQDAMVTIIEDGKNQTPTVRSGVAKVNVTAINGPIKKGDHISASKQPGKGQKMDPNQTISLGTALEDFDGTNTSDGDGTSLSSADSSEVKLGKIMVSIKIESLSTAKTTTDTTQFLGSIGKVLLKNINNPDKFGDTMKLLISGAIVIMGFLIGFVTFTRTVPKGIEAIGRNPLAKNLIYFAVGLNIFFTLATILIAIGIALVILKL